MSDQSTPTPVDSFDANQKAITVAYGALLEVGRRDLAESIIGFDDDDGFGFYLEVNDDILSEADWAIVNQAETLARQSIGQPPAVREGVS